MNVLLFLIKYSLQKMQLLKIRKNSFGFMKKNFAKLKNAL